MGQDGSMSERPGDRVQELFDQAVGLPPSQRAAFLEAACADDPDLRAEVESLLASDADFPDGAGDEGVLKSPLVRSPEPTSSGVDEPIAAAWAPGPPACVGRYRILRRVAEGGMGAVYEAEQDRPRRAVALKVVRPGLASPALLKRFTHEAQILGRLHHPGIAQVYEAGLADDGQPFFAMEFIRGLPLDEYANRHGLDLAARVGLLARVCDAVQHAHDQGVIHRDLKPANILVEETGQPKVLDFGVARATDADLLTGAGLTQTGQLLGTPSYMSPEQVTADPAAIDHRADVYALGVILFELVAHRLPYQLENRPLAEAARLILEQDPPRLGSIDPEAPRRRGDDRGQGAGEGPGAALPVGGGPGGGPAALAGPRADPGAAAVGAVPHPPVRPAAQGPGGRGGRHRGGPGPGARRHDPLCRRRGPAARPGRAERPAAIARARHFQAYRARLAAAAAALSGARRGRCRAPARRGPGGPARLGMAAPAQPARRQLFGDPVARRGVGFLLAAPDRLRVGAWTGAGVSVTDLEGGEPRTLPIGPGHRHAVTAAQTRRGVRVVAWVGNTAFDLLDEAGRVLCRVEMPEAKEPGPVVVSPDGSRLAAGRNDGEWKRLAVFDATSGKQTAVCDGHRGGIWGFTFSPDGTRLASAGEDRTARLWDPATGALLATCRGHTSKVLGAAFRPDGARLVTTSSDGTVRQWDAATGREVEAPYDRHSGEVAAAVYSPDGQWVASAGTDRTIRVWRATGRQDVAVLHGHTGAVSGVAFAPDGRRVASLSGESMLGWAGDGTVRVWEVDPRATLPVLRGHTSYVYPVAFSPDGRWIASGGWDNTVRLWDAATGEPCATLPHPGVVPSSGLRPRRDVAGERHLRG